MELGWAWHANRCVLKVLADGDLKNGLTSPKKGKRSRTVLKGMITFPTLIHARAPEGDLCSPSVCDCTSACMSVHAYQIYFRGTRVLFIFPLSFIWKLTAQFFSILSTCFSSRLSGISGKVRTETKNYKDRNKSTRLCFCHLFCI